MKQEEYNFVVKESCGKIAMMADGKKHPCLITKPCWKHPEIDGIIYEIAERIVIDYANLSGRDIEHRAEFRGRILKYLEKVKSETLQDIKRWIEPQLLDMAQATTVEEAEKYAWGIPIEPRQRFYALLDVYRQITPRRR